MFQTIVLALDGSESSDLAYGYAADLARSTGARIVAVHVKEIMASRGGGAVHLNEDELQEKVRGQVKTLTEAGVQARVEMHSTMVGGPAHVIAEAAQRENADVIITGTRGHTGLAGVVLGSVAQRLLHLASCPVLVVPPNSPRRGAAAKAGKAAATA